MPRRKPQPPPSSLAKHDFPTELHAILTPHLKSQAEEATFSIDETYDGRGRKGLRLALCDRTEFLTFARLEASVAPGGGGLEDCAMVTLENLRKHRTFAPRELELDRRGHLFDVYMILVGILSEIAGEVRLAEELGMIERATESQLTPQGMKPYELPDRPEYLNATDLKVLTDGLRMRIVELAKKPPAPPAKPKKKPAPAPAGKTEEPHGD
jgi:hypothetical protein